MSLISNALITMATLDKELCTQFHNMPALMPDCLLGNLQTHTGGREVGVGGQTRGEVGPVNQGAVPYRYDDSECLQYLYLYGIVVQFH